MDLNRAFSLSLDGKAAIGDAIHAIEHPLSAGLCHALARGEGGRFRHGRCVYELLRSDAGRTVIIGRPSVDGMRGGAYEALFLKSSVPMLLLDPSHATVFDANIAASLFFDRPRERLEGLPSAELLGERCGTFTGSDRCFLTRLRSPSGNESDVEVDCRHIIVDDRELVLAIVRVPEEKILQRALQSEQRYRALSDAAFEGIVIHSNNIILECDQTFADMTGLPPERLIGTNLLELVHADDRELVMRQVASGGIDPYEISLRSGNGTFRRTSIKGRQVVHDGRPARVATFLDVNEWEMASAGLERERAMLRAIMDSLPVGVIITDPLGKFVENNEITSLIWGGHMHAEDLFEYDQFVAFEHLTGEQVRPEEWGLARALLHGETSVGELYDIVRFDGGRRSVVISAAPVMGADGEILGGVEITQDITGQRELERSEIVAKGRAELYLDILTHDIANFNTALMGYLVRLYYDRCDETSVPSNVNKCLGVLHASNELISIIQTVQRAGEGARERRDLGGMLQEVASELPVPPDRKVFIEQDIETGLLIDCNGLLREAFVNLLNNAVVHTTGEVRVTIRAWRSDERAVVSVENDGRGIDDAFKARLFDRRVRGPGSEPGQGLGLFLMRTLVEDHGGTVKVEDRVAGDDSQGVRFVVSLPLAQ